MEKYQIQETIPKLDGTKVYCINEKKDEICGVPVVVEIYRGTLDQCQEQIKKLNK